MKHDFLAFDKNVDEIAPGLRCVVRQRARVLAERDWKGNEVYLPHHVCNMNYDDRGFVACVEVVNADVDGNGEYGFSGSVLMKEPKGTVLVRVEREAALFKSHDVGVPTRAIGVTIPFVLRRMMFCYPCRPCRVSGLWDPVRLPLRSDLRCLDCGGNRFRDKEAFAFVRPRPKPKSWRLPTFDREYILDVDSAWPALAEAAE